MAIFVAFLSRFLLFVLLRVLVCLVCFLIVSRLVHLRNMNECDVAALDKLVVYGRCWEGEILCPNEDGSGEYNLLCEKAVQFRQTMFAGKEGGSPVSSHSRQRAYGIPIPTKFDAIAGEWNNVKQQLGLCVRRLVRATPEA